MVQVELTMNPPEGSDFVCSYRCDSCGEGSTHSVGPANTLLEAITHADTLSTRNHRIIARIFFSVAVQVLLLQYEKQLEVSVVDS